jgi:hypothetical protein
MHKIESDMKQWISGGSGIFYRNDDNTVSTIELRTGRHYPIYEKIFVGLGMISCKIVCLRIFNRKPLVFQRLAFDFAVQNGILHPSYDGTAAKTLRKGIMKHHRQCSLRTLQ